MVFHEDVFVDGPISGRFLFEKLPFADYHLQQRGDLFLREFDGLFFFVFHVRSPFGPCMRSM